MKNTQTISLTKKAMTLLALMLPVIGFANPPAGNFPTPQAQTAQGQVLQKVAPAKYPPAQQFPSMQMPWSQQTYQSYPYQMPYTYGTPWMQQPSYQYNPYQQNQAYQPKQVYPQNKAYPPKQMNYNTPNYQFSNMQPFGNGFSPTSMFNNNTFPTPWSNSNTWNPWSNGNNSQMPFFNQQNNNKKKAWGDVRNIWPDFYTEFTEEMWDKSTNAPADMGRMPGGWKAPSLSSPDPVTVGDAVLNQFPPIMEEMGNMMNFSN